VVAVGAAVVGGKTRPTVLTKGKLSSGVRGEFALVFCVTPPVESDAPSRYTVPMPLADRDGQTSGVIRIRGARVHNLKNIDLDLPRHRLIVVTGLSGSGKSSLAFDTLYAEGQRRYVESLSAYARQFLEQLDKPDVEAIEGLPPAIAIEQRTAGANPRSTVATQTEIYDYLRLLFARVGTPHCPQCRRPIVRQSAQEMVMQLERLPRGQELTIFAPVVRGRKGEFHDLFRQLKREGFVRLRVDGVVRELEEPITLDKQKPHTIEVVVDRVPNDAAEKSRITESVETALRVGKGIVIVSSASSVQRLPLRSSVSLTLGRAKEGSAKIVQRPPSSGKTQNAQRSSLNAQRPRPDRGGRTPNELIFSELYACPTCSVSLDELSPRVFSFNSPYGACPTCAGLGTRVEIDPELIVPDPSLSIRDGAIHPWRRGGRYIVLYYRWLLREAARALGFSLDAPFQQLPARIQKVILYGSPPGDEKRFEGVIPNLERRFRETESEFVKHDIAKIMSILPCPACHGHRLKPTSLAVTVQGHSIMDVTRLSIAEALTLFEALQLTPMQAQIAHHVRKEIIQRLHFLLEVGLDYLTLDRSTSSLSGGEAQRIRLATQVGSGLVGVLYILDEPSIGLHQRDNRKLLDTLVRLRELGNTVVVIEHDEETIRRADYIVDLGPGAGKHGGDVVACGTLEDITRARQSFTGKYLTGELAIPVPRTRRPWQGRPVLRIEGAAEHNLKRITVEFPLGVFVCVTGVSGSGKSTLVDDILYRALAQRFYHSREKPGQHQAIRGLEHIDHVIVIDQSPIGRTPRSNPATYTGTYSLIRDVFAVTPEAKVRGFRPGRFSFNVKGGRCEACAGDGIKQIEMHFLPDVYVTCEVCKGKRFNEPTLQVQYKGHSIAEVLAMTVEEALQFFAAHPAIRAKLQTIADVGLGYIELGQSATTLSGGEAQRVKLAKELSKRSTGRTLYLLDEPTTGLHVADIAKLLNVLHALVAQGNTVVVIEHNLEVIKTADYLIDLGPEGGAAGGEVVATGSPEEVARVARSYTGQFLRATLRKSPRTPAPPARASRGEPSRNVLFEGAR